MKVIIADDSALLREGLARLLEDRGFDVVAQTDNAEDLIRRVSGLRPDVAIVDICMPPTFTDDGLRAAEALGESHPGVGVVLLSQHLEAAYAKRLLRKGTSGRGYLLKERVTELDAFAESIRTVANGASIVDPQVVASVVNRREPGLLDALSAREREILALMAEGRSNHAISQCLELSGRTVESHVRTVFRKLGLRETEDDHRRVLAVLTYLRA